MRCTGASRSAFTLLESIIALAMIGAVAGACLQVRAQSLAGRQRLTVRQNTDRGIETILRLAQAGLLDGGRIEKDESERMIRVNWIGDHLGEPFTCQRERVTMTNPIDQREGAAEHPTIELWQWTVTYRNETAQVFTPKGSSR